MKLGNTSFNPESVKTQFSDFKSFEKIYKGILQGYGIKQAYEVLTGRKIKSETDGIEEITKPTKKSKKV